MAGLLEVIGTLATDSDGTLSATPTDKRQLLPNLGGLLNGLGGLTSAIPGVLSGITGAVPSVVPQVISGVANAVPSLVHGVTSAIPSIVGGVTSALPGILDPLTSALPGGGLSSIGGLDNVSAVVHLVIDLLTSILNIVNQFSGISNLTHSLAAGPEQLIVGLLSSILSSVGGIVPLAGIAGTLAPAAAPTSLLNDILGSIGI